MAGPPGINHPDKVCATRDSCDVCRTINLAKAVKRPKPDMEMYEKKVPLDKFTCTRVPEPVVPTCIKVCSKEEYKMRKSGIKPVAPKMPHYAHGRVMYGVKAGILIGSIYFTYTQGVWGDQIEVTECLNRWQEYLKSINTRRPPTFDHCGNVVIKKTVESPVGPVYTLYKHIITTCFNGIVKIPLLIKCAYFDYLKALDEKQRQELKERAIKRRG